jgi:hypothetical protein
MIVIGAFLFNLSQKISKNILADFPATHADFATAKTSMGRLGLFSKFLQRVIHTMILNTTGLWYSTLLH